MDKIKIQGYHGTSGKSAKNILHEKKFNLSKKNNEWLGEGVYFWDKLEHGMWWANKHFKCKNPHVIECELTCSKDKYLNLDKEMNKLEDFGQQYVEEMKQKTNSAPSFRTNNEAKKFFCTLYAKKFDIKIISFTFKYSVFNNVGFQVDTIERNQICVTDNNNINIIELKEVSI